MWTLPSKSVTAPWLPFAGNYELDDPTRTAFVERGMRSDPVETRTGSLSRLNWPRTLGVGAAAWLALGLAGWRLGRVDC